MTATDLGFESSFPVCVNEHLTRQSKQLLGAAVQKKKQVNWKFAWTAGGKVCMWRDEQAPALRIASMADLDKMTSLPG